MYAIPRTGAVLCEAVSDIGWVWLSQEVAVLAQTVRFLDGAPTLGEHHPACQALGYCWRSLVSLVGSDIGGTGPVASAFSAKLCIAAFGAAKVSRKAACATILLRM